MKWYTLIDQPGMMSTGKKFLTRRSAHVASSRSNKRVVSDFGPIPCIFKNECSWSIWLSYRLYQIPGELNGAAGRFEYIVNQANQLTHQLFVPGGTINGIPIDP